jgi:hypothetical protein
MFCTAASELSTSRSAKTVIWLSCVDVGCFVGGLATADADISAIICTKKNFFVNK